MSLAQVRVAPLSQDRVAPGETAAERREHSEVRVTPGRRWRRAQDRVAPFCQVRVAPPPSWSGSPPVQPTPGPVPTRAFLPSPASSPSPLLSSLPLPFPPPSLPPLSLSFGAGAKFFPALGLHDPTTGFRGMVSGLQRVPTSVGVGVGLRALAPGSGPGHPLVLQERVPPCAAGPGRPPDGDLAGSEPSSRSGSPPVERLGRVVGYRPGPGHPLLRTWPFRPAAPGPGRPPSRDLAVSLSDPRSGSPPAARSGSPPVGGWNRGEARDRVVPE